jgi:cation transport ATPase
VFVALDGVVAGFVAISDAIRPEAPAAVAALQVRTDVAWSSPAA